MISSLQRLLCPAVLLAALVLFGARASGTIVGGEFYLGDDPGEGNGDALNHLEP